MMRFIIAICALVIGATVFAPAAGAADSAVIFVYHRFGESQFPATSVRLDQFEAQIDELKKGGYTVMAVPEIVDAIRSGRDLPDMTVGLSVDDAYESAFKEAWPRLKAAGFPMTVFVATDPVDKGFRDYMSWDQIRQLAKEGVAIGAHTASHLHMADATDETNADEIARSNARFQAELGAVPKIFAYPYGEASKAVRDRVQSSGYAIAFGQHSGVIYRGSDFFYLPRFAINEHYGTISDFRMRARALALPVQGLTPDDPVIGINPPVISFTVDASVARLDALACFTAESGGVPFKRLEGNRIEVRIAEPIPPGRFRLSCTLPAGDKRYRWFGTAFYVRPRNAKP